MRARPNAVVVASFIQVTKEERYLRMLTKERAKRAEETARIHHNWRKADELMAAQVRAKQKGRNHTYVPVADGTYLVRHNCTMPLPPPPEARMHDDDGKTTHCPQAMDTAKDDRCGPHACMHACGAIGAPPAETRACACVLDRSFV